LLYTRQSQSKTRTITNAIVLPNSTETLITTLTGLNPLVYYQIVGNIEVEIINGNVDTIHLYTRLENDVGVGFSYTKLYSNTKDLSWINITTNNTNNTPFRKFYIQLNDLVQSSTIGSVVCKIFVGYTTTNNPNVVLRINQGLLIPLQIQNFI
jgi:hypothetical protein